MENKIIHSQNAGTNLHAGATLLQADNDLTAIYRLLVTVLKPVCIYRIAHRVLRGGGIRWYCSLFVLLPNSCTKPAAEYDALTELVQLQHEDVRCTVHRMHTVREWIRQGHPFYSRHLVHRNLLYSDGSAVLPAVEPAVSAAMKADMVQRFTALSGKAAGFLHCAVHLWEQGPGSRALVGFMLQQAVELGYRSLLESLNGHCHKTHDIRQLKKQCFRCAPWPGEVFPDDSPEERRLVDLLQAAYSGSRYNNSHSIGSTDLALLIARAGRFLSSSENTFFQELAAC